MGGSVSSEEYEELNPRQKQYQQRSCNQQYPPQMRQQQHHQQREQQQWQRQQGQQQHRHISTLSTPDLLDYLECEFKSAAAIIENMKKEKMFDLGGRGYILDVITEMGQKLGNLYRGMNKKELHKSTYEDDKARYKEEIHDSKKENSRLKKEKQYLDGLLTSSMREPNTSKKGPAMCESSRYNNGRSEQNDNLKSEHDITQRLRACTRELEHEKEARAQAVSYIEHLKEVNNELKVEKDELKIRLSKLAGERLTESNPAIADLSDPNRPTKIGEMYSEVYDNEWTDAFEALVKAGYEEIEAVETLRLTLLNVIQFCGQKSDSLLKKTEEAVNILFEEYKASEQKRDMRHLTMPRNLAENWGKVVQRPSFDLDAICLQQKWIPLQQSDGNNKQTVKTLAKPNTSGEVIGKQLKIFRKEVAVSMVPLVEKAYLSASWNEECIYDIKPFIRKCILIGWMMVVQSPPMALAEFKPNEELKKEVYKEYTASGTHIDYIVWPALLLQKGGAVVGKGVAQGKKMK